MQNESEAYTDGELPDHPWIFVQICKQLHPTNTPPRAPQHYRENLQLIIAPFHLWFSALTHRTVHSQLVAVHSERHFTAMGQLQLITPPVSQMSIRLVSVNKVGKVHRLHHM